MQRPVQRIGIILAIAAGSAAAVFAEMRVSTSEALEKATVKAKPEYSAIARNMKVSGKAEIEVVIGTDGSVEDAKALSGNPLLTASSIAAAKKWKFTPFKSNGEPAKAVTILSFNFQ